MFTRPKKCVRVTARNFEGRKAGKSKSVTIYGTTAEAIIDEIARRAQDQPGREQKKTA